MKKKVTSGEGIPIAKCGNPLARQAPVMAKPVLDQRAEVVETFQRLRLLSRGMRLKGDLKTAAREGLD